MSQYDTLKVVLLADDDPDDWVLVQNALQDTGIPMDLRMVLDGEELMDYLMQRGKYSDESLAPEPSLILLDLNMPKKDGREALAEIKADRSLRRIPIVVFTTSKEEQDIQRCYELGASSYVSKPCSFAGLLEMAKTVGKYWLEIVELPRRKARTAPSVSLGEDNKTYRRRDSSWNL